MQSDTPHVPKLPENFLFSTDFSSADFSMITTALQSTDWAANISRDQVVRAFRHSKVIGARSMASQDLVGFARAVTDYAVYGYLTDLFVVPEVRSSGIASAMVSWLINSEELKHVTHLTLLASKPSIEALGRAHGFNKTEWQSAWLERIRE